MAPAATLPAGANRPAKAKPAPSAKSPREADAQSPERKRKIPPSADPPETNKGKKKKGKTRSPSAETKAKPAPSAKSPREADAQSPERKRKIPPSADPPETNKGKKKKGKTRSPSAETEKPLPLEHAWTPCDVVRILEAMAAHRKNDEQGKLPRSKDLFASLDGRLDSKGFGLQDLRRKVRSLKRRHDVDAIKGDVPAEEHDCRLYLLSKKVWDANPEPVATSEGAVVPKVCNTVDEMRQLYPCLAHELVHIVDDPAVLERVLLGIDGSKAHALNSKINGLREELTRAITESAKIQNIEVSKGWQCPYNNLWPAKSTAANQSLLYLDRIDKIQGCYDVVQAQFTRIGHELVKVKQDIIASGPSQMLIRSESAESAPQSVVAEKQFSHNVKQRKILAQEKLACGDNKEVTSKYRHPQNLPRKMILEPKKIHRARREKMNAESQILHGADQRKVAGRACQGLFHHTNVEGGKQVILLSCLRPHKPVAKATLQTCSPSTIVGGKALGPGCCQVLVNEVLDGKALLIRPFGTMNTMADTLGSSIAWIRENTRHDSTAGIVAPNQPSPGKG